MDPTLAQIRSSLVTTLLSITNHSISLPTLPSPPQYPHLTPAELALLNEYTTLQHLTFQKTLTESTLSTLPSSSKDEDLKPEDLDRLQHELAEARLKNQIKTRAIESILSTTPTLAASFGSPSAGNAIDPSTPLNPRILSHRDELTSSHGLLLQTITDLKQRETELQVERGRVEEENREMAERIRELARKVEGVEVEEEAEVREERRREEWRLRVLRGVLGGLVVGSGVDWARDEELAELVLRCGEE